ncbi:MFS-1 [Dacryopinax primogenitus]|uniref:MFS-1 n=1 Tax=Dacryopinax primogenitus (strain DJM 731) TaxID=1858805 RepID=M5FU87_DACPD|nr:MFS-1 [Dacryopinax primogenitus]EJU01271.1 MFS-1 [Dacryopinax primogenitus]
MAQIFGRQSSVLTFIFLFAVGSAVSGSAQNMTAMIAGRTVQGLGAGGILSMSEIVVSDLVPLRERGMYQGIINSVWALAGVTGPPIAGGFAGAGQWRWLFYINLPLCGVAFGLTFFFLKLKRPPGSVREKLGRIDWIGNGIIIIASTIVTLALVEGGIIHPWNSFQILVPLVIGIVGIGLFLVYENFWVIGEPMVPFDILSNRTSLSGYAAKSQHPALSVSFHVSPLLITAITVSATNHYVTQNVTSWALIMIGAGLMTTFTKDSSTATWVGYQIITAIGIGGLYAATTFPVLAPLSITKNAHALAFYIFLRTFAQTFGVSIGATVLQNELIRNLPSAFFSLFPADANIAYAAILQIPSLPEPLQDEVRVAFATSLSTLWKVTLGLAGGGADNDILHETDCFASGDR